MSTNDISVLDSYRYLASSKWWTGRDLNPRPFGCEPNITTPELPALQFVYGYPDIKYDYYPNPR